MSGINRYLLICIVGLLAFTTATFAESLNVPAPAPFMQGDELRGKRMYLAIKGMFRNKKDAEAFREQLGPMPDGYPEGLDFSTHYDGPSKGYWIVFSAFDSKEKAKTWLETTPLPAKRKTKIKKVIKHSGTKIPFNRDV